jgi:hypothetical protein
MKYTPEHTTGQLRAGDLVIDTIFNTMFLVLAVSHVTKKEAKDESVYYADGDPTGNEITHAKYYYMVCGTDQYIKETYHGQYKRTDWDAELLYSQEYKILSRAVM